MNKIHIDRLIVKDEFSIPSVIETLSGSEKISVVEIADSDKKVTIVEQQPPDILPGKVADQSHVDRLEDVPPIKPQFTIPVVYLHSSLDLWHTKEPELLTKAVYVDVPYEFVQPKTTIDLADEQNTDKVKKATAISRQAITQREILTVLPDSFFIKHNTRFVKILFSEILVLKKAVTIYWDCKRVQFTREVRIQCTNKVTCYNFINN